MSTPTTAARPAAPAAPGGAPAAVVVPPAADGAQTSWRRLVTAVTPGGAGARALEGPWLDPGTAYELPPGAVVVTCDRLPRRWEVRMLRVTDTALEEHRAWTLKNPMGKRVSDWIGRRLAPGADGHTARLLEARPNRWTGWCLHCRRPVPAGQGVLVPGDGRHFVAHRPGGCPPPPEVVEPNRRGEACLLCGRWVLPGTGVALRLTQPDAVTGARYRAAHKDACPLDGPLGPPNREAGWCADCGELVDPGAGWWDPAEVSRLRHAGVCPEPTVSEATWMVRRRRGEPRFQPGQVRRVRLDLRGGVARMAPPGMISDILVRRPDNPPVPPHLPGYRALRADYVEIVAVVLETVQGRTRQQARVRAASLAEAADVLAEEISAAADGPRPNDRGFRARFEAEKIGDARPWLAEITGRHPDYGYERRFVPADRDYADANSKGTRGVVYSWVLAQNRVYEAEYWTSRRRVVRKFLRAGADGDAVELTQEEVESWLNGAAEWLAS